MQAQTLFFAWIQTHQGGRCGPFMRLSPLLFVLIDADTLRLTAFSRQVLIPGEGKDAVEPEPSHVGGRLDVVASCCAAGTADASSAQNLLAKPASSP